MIMPPLTTKRLLIRPFLAADAADYQRISAAVGWVNPKMSEEALQQEFQRYIQHNILNVSERQRLYQPPYGDRAIVDLKSGRLVGAIGLVTCLQPFAQLDGFFPDQPPIENALFSSEMGLFYIIDPAYHRQGIATEAAEAVVDFCFRELRLNRIIATTEYDNAGSIGVMRRLGMRMTRNAFKEPHWLQVVGVKENGG